MINYSEYLIFRATVALFRILPFPALYVLSNLLAFTLRVILRYRFAVTHENLCRAFPDLDKEDFNRILKQSYLNLSDILLESIKGMSMSERTLRRRFRFSNLDLLNRSTENGQSIVLLLGHVCNWEWGAISLGMYVKQHCIGVYKQIKNPYIERFTRKRRSRTGLILAHTKETGQILKKYADVPATFILIADQNPSNPKRAYWVDFMGEKTAFHHGPGSISRTNDFPLYYLSTRRQKRGYYEVFIERLIENPKDHSGMEILEKYAARLEEQIRDQPADWLWSHRRWKHRWEGKAQN